MKSRILSIGLLFVVIILPMTSIFGQCKVTRDSIIDGLSVGVYTDYIYSGGKLIQSIQRDDFSEFRASVVTIDAGTGLIATIVSVDPNDNTNRQTIEFVINNGRVERVNASGQQGVGLNVWTLSHDISYSNGKISGIILDGNSITGDPEGLGGSFINMVWQNGNVVTMAIVIGSDTLPLIITYDAKNNIKSKLLNTEGAVGLFLSENTNNVLNIAASVSGALIGATVAMGDKLLESEYTYINNDVQTLREIPTLFTTDDITTKYLYDCLSSITPSSSVIRLGIYPNPAKDFIHLESGDFSGVLKIYDIVGKVIRKLDIKGQQSLLDVSYLDSGMYYIEIVDGQDIYSGKLLKN